MTDKNKQPISVGDTLKKGTIEATVHAFEDDLCVLDNGLIKFKVNQAVLNDFVIIKRAENGTLHD
jgi:hypothetical protein